MINLASSKLEPLIFNFSANKLDIVFTITLMVLNMVWPELGERSGLKNVDGTGSVKRRSALWTKQWTCANLFVVLANVTTWKTRNSKIKTHVIG